MPRFQGIKNWLQIPPDAGHHLLRSGAFGLGQPLCNRLHLGEPVEDKLGVYPLSVVHRPFSSGIRYRTGSAEMRAGRFALP